VTGVFIERNRNYGSDRLSAPVRMLMHRAAISQPQASAQRRLMALGVGNGRGHTTMTSSAGFSRRHLRRLR